MRITNMTNRCYGLLKIVPIEGSEICAVYMDSNVGTILLLDIPDNEVIQIVRNFEDLRDHEDYYEDWIYEHEAIERLKNLCVTK